MCRPQSCNCHSQRWSKHLRHRPEQFECSPNQRRRVFSRQRSCPDESLRADLMAPGSLPGYPCSRSSACTEQKLKAKSLRTQHRRMRARLTALSAQHAMSSSEMVYGFSSDGFVAAAIDFGGRTYGYPPKQNVTYESHIGEVYR